MVVASIRYNNPGAMWGNKLAQKWGASPNAVSLNDGLGQGNNIAVFPSKLSGACAQFDLWRTGYCNRTLRQAILKWSGGNWSGPYANDLSRSTGIGLDDMITPALLAGPKGWLLMKTQAKWEAGQPYPLSDLEWQQAQSKVFGGVGASIPPVTKKKAVAVVATTAATGTAATQIASQGHHWGIVFAILILGALIATGLWFWLHRSHDAATAPPAPRRMPSVPKLTVEDVQRALDADKLKGDYP